jgi:tRNA (mo5U34)-methyltransferase
MTARDRLSPDQIQERSAELAGRWWHSIDLGDGLVTRGHKGTGRLDAEWRSLELPSLSGKAVLDIGAWDGYFSFRSEREGAARVVALDHYVWSLDPAELQSYNDRQRRLGLRPLPFDQVPELWKPHELPGKRCFDFARDALGSGVDDIVGDFMEIDLAELGTFDVVLYLGVLYHVTDPIGALRRLAAVTEEVAVIETEALSVWPYNRQPLWLFVGDDRVDGDPTNWWVPNLRGLEDACLAAGFSRVTLGLGPTGVPLNEVEALTGERSAKRRYTRPYRLALEIPKGRYTTFRAVARAWK